MRRMEGEEESDDFVNEMFGEHKHFIEMPHLSLHEYMFLYVTQDAICLFT